MTQVTQVTQVSDDIKEIFSRLKTDWAEIKIVDITPGQKMNYDWPTGDRYPKVLEDERVIINLEGELLAYCRDCDYYHPYENMSSDTHACLGVKFYCKIHYNERDRQREATKRNGFSNGHSNNGSLNVALVKNATESLRSTNIDALAEIADAEDKAGHMQVLERHWNINGKEIDFETLKSLGIVDYFVYIRRWINISEETKSAIEKEFGDIEPFYVGQTNGEDFNYPGSGKHLDRIKKLTGTEGEMRIIRAAPVEKINQAEQEAIADTGAMQYGLNELPGTTKPKTWSTKVEFDFADDRQLELYQVLHDQEKTNGMPIAEGLINMAMNGLDTLCMVEKMVRSEAWSGNIAPASNWLKILSMPRDNRPIW